jgi:CheY-like chemotaxis protein
MLIVEHTDETRDFLKNTIASLHPDMVIFEADSGKAAMETLRSETFDIVLCDLDLPDMKGCKVFKRIELDAKIRKPYCIMIINDITKELILEAIHSGANDCIIKTITPDLLGKKIGRAIEQINRSSS